MGQSELEEKTFLSLCSPHDRGVLTGNEEMTFNDFERIAYLTMIFGFTEYTVTLHMRYMDFTIKLEEKLDRENEIMKEYPDYYLDEQVGETSEKWIDDFLSQLPADKQRYYRRLVKED